MCMCMSLSYACYGWPLRWMSKPMGETLSLKNQGLSYKDIFCVKFLKIMCWMSNSIYIGIRKLTKLLVDRNKLSKIFEFSSSKSTPKNPKSVQIVHLTSVLQKIRRLFLGDFLGLNFLSEFLKKVLSLIVRILIYYCSGSSSASNY